MTEEVIQRILERIDERFDRFEERLKKREHALILLKAEEIKKDIAKTENRICFLEEQCEAINSEYNRLLKRRKFLINRWQELYYTHNYEAPNLDKRLKDLADKYRSLQHDIHNEKITIMNLDSRLSELNKLIWKNEVEEIKSSFSKILKSESVRVNDVVEEKISESKSIVHVAPQNNDDIKASTESFDLPPSKLNSISAIPTWSNFHNFHMVLRPGPRPYRPGVGILGAFSDARAVVARLFSEDPD